MGLGLSLSTPISLWDTAECFLSQTNLRLLKGRRYGLVGPNGAGKSTLMTSIAEAKLGGFPPPPIVRTVYVEPDHGEDITMSVLEYLTKDSDSAMEGTEYVSKALAEFGFDPGPGGQDQKVNSLSGGNMMKLSLERAMLKKPDVLLLDEPTNHLNAANIKWLQEYLISHPELTVLIVSHDSSFLDTVLRISITSSPRRSWRISKAT
jgi:elongation factor 3